MRAEFNFNNRTYLASLDKPIDLSIAIRSGADVLNAFYAADPVIKPFVMGDFIGSVAHGAPVNTNDILFNPHGNGTHTECMGHISPGMESVNRLIKTYFLPSLLVTVVPENSKGDMIVTAEMLEKNCDQKVPEALIVRTLPNETSKINRRYSGTNPPYFHLSAIRWLVDKNVQHLLIDLPSVDREEDGGKLAGHKAFWNLDGSPRRECSITELIYVPDDVLDGLYLLNLQIAAFENDASPSRPLIFKAEAL